MNLDLAALPNVNAVWATLLVDELVRHGVADFVIAPGSRSTPLVVAAVRNAHSQTHLCRDERAAGFFALGIARARGHAAAVITTSGTAVANLLPSVVEAAQDGVPLVLLTADRPFELQDCGANQTITQPGLFGSYPVWQLSLPAPDDRIPARTVLTVAAHAAARAHTDLGPVHLDCAYREPLAPDAAGWDRACLAGTERWAATRTPFTTVHVSAAEPSDDALAEVAAKIAGAERGLLVAAQGFEDADAKAIAAAAVAWGWPLWADARGVLRGRGSAALAPHTDRLLAEHWQPEVVVQCGGHPTSARLERFVANAALTAHVVIDARLRRLDPGHRASDQIVGAPAQVLPRLTTRANGARSRPALVDTANAAIEAALAERLDGDGELSEPFCARWLSRQLPVEHAVVLSSSMPVRDWQTFAASGGRCVEVFANRGASGIDGVLATAIGCAVGRDRPVTLLIGDQALLHDSGSLALLAESARPITVVVLDNHGGGIFTKLPIVAHDDVFSPWFDGAHGHRLGDVARGFGLPVASPTSRADFAEACHSAWQRRAPAVVEVRLSMRDHVRHHQELERAIDEALRGACR